MVAAWLRKTSGPRHAAVLSGLFVLTLGSSAVAPSQAQEPDFAQPQRHFRVERPASLDANSALVVYNSIIDDMVAGYQVSRDPAARAYRGWRRYNRVPYRSATHGDRYINNYGNAIARDYGRFGDVGELPVGAVLAKDSFAVTAQGDVFTGPLFLMEKMDKGFDPENRNWRYSMILPDGSIFGETKGDNATRVGFCTVCHQAAGDDNDHLFFVPEDNRVTVYRLDEITD